MAETVAIAARITPVSAVLNKKNHQQHRATKCPSSGRGGGAAATEVLRVLRQDADFLWFSTKPIRKVVSDAFWFRFLEKSGAAGETRRRPVPLPDVRYPPGLTCMDLIMADIELLKLYMNYYSQYFRIWSTPLPEYYDPDIVSDYFFCRPHVLAFRILEVLFASLSAAVKLRTSERSKLFAYAGETAERGDSSRYFVGQLLKETLLNLGPVFVKVGQSLSTRPDIIGSEISEVLSELHENVPPFPREVAIKIIETELKCPVENVFSYISNEPVAAASFGQVYQGCTIDGTTVAIKVQRPNLLHSVVRDIYILRLGLVLLRRINKRRSDPSLYADELGRGFVNELDYRIEAEHALTFMKAHSRYSFMRVPKIYRHYSGKRVLTMEWMMGENPNDLLSLCKGYKENNGRLTDRQKSEAKARLIDLVHKGVEATLVQLLETGLLHADPHPGNLRYTSDGCIGFLDFGLLCSMKRKHQLAMLASIVHIVIGDWAALVYDLCDMDVIPPHTDIRPVKMDLEDALGEVSFDSGIPDVKYSKVLAKIWSVAFKHHLRMPPYYTLVLRSLASFEGLAVAVDPSFKTFQATCPFVVRKLLLENSIATRNILYSVVLNRRKELQWQKIMLFVNLASLRSPKVQNGLVSSDTSVQFSNVVPEGVINTVNYILELLISKDGVVLRRLLMTADSKSLLRTSLSPDAAFFRQYVCRDLAEVFYRWMINIVGGYNVIRQYNHQLFVHEADNAKELRLSSVSPPFALQRIRTDRRLKIIFFKILRDVRSDPWLMLQASWCFATVFMTAAALAAHGCLVHLVDVQLSSLSSPPKQVVTSS